MNLRVQLIILFFSFSLLNGANLRVEIEDLSKNLSSYKVIDVRAQELYEEGHIKGSLNLPISLTYDNLKISGKLTEPNKMQKILRGLGLDVDDKIVIYDDGSFFDAARLFWGLEVYGFKEVKLLNAGFSQWDILDLPISKESPKVEKSSYIASIDNKKLATKFSTQIATKSPSQLIIDARGNKAYIGETSNAKRFGHIPNALNIPASYNITTDDSVSKLKSLEELKEVYKDLDKNKKIVSYCSIGRVSSSNYFALRELDYDVANYDASWKEWGNDFNLPIEK